MKCFWKFSCAGHKNIYFYIIWPTFWVIWVYMDQHTQIQTILYSYSVLPVATQWKPTIEIWQCFTIFFSPHCWRLKPSKITFIFENFYFPFWRNYSNKRPTPSWFRFRGCSRALGGPQWTRTHQCTIHWMPLMSQLWMNLNWVTTWSHLGNPFNKK